MKVELLSYTPDAVNLLLRTKNTRLKFESDPAGWSEEAKASHLRYMLGTIKSSWEFVDYTFEITGVTRAFTHQLVRTRTGSYAQESQRTVDASDNPVIKPALTGSASESWDVIEKTIMNGYSSLISNHGVHPQDARGLLPTNISTGIICKFNLRTLHDSAKTRLCTRTQGEYQRVFRLMRERVLEVHPWAEDFINVQCVQDGTCAFPEYGKKDCPIWFNELDRSNAKVIAKERFKLLLEGGVVNEAKPVAKNGRTMSHE